MVCVFSDAPYGPSYGNFATTTRRRSALYAVRFSSPVLPGDLLTAELWTEGKTVFVQTKNESGDVVLKNGMIELA